MKGTVSAILLLVSMALQGSAAVFCPGLEEACPFKIEGDVLGEGGLFVSEDILTDRCRDIIELVECQTSYLANCSISNYIPFVELSKGVLELLKELCDENTELRANYILYRPCFQSNPSVFSGCVADAFHEVRAFENNLGITGELEKVPEKLCKFHDTFTNCAVSKINQRCGAKAAEHLEVLLTKPVAELKATKCNQV